jgi:hypothetical protein
MIQKYRVSFTTLLSYARVRGQNIKNKVQKILDELRTIDYDR